MIRYIRNILVALDQLLGAICGLDPDESISSYCGKRQQYGHKYPAVIIDFFFGKGHCLRNIEKDEGKDGVLPPPRIK